jgi:hypothetical protein
MFSNDHNHDGPFTYMTFMSTLNHYIKFQLVQDTYIWGQMKIKALMKDCQVQFVNDHIKGFSERVSCFLGISFFSVILFEFIIN